MCLFSNLKPDYFVGSIYDIDKLWLEERRILALIIDVDSTMTARGTYRPDPKLRQWVKGLDASGVKLLAVSNNWGERVRGITKALEIDLLAPAVKPFRPVLRKAVVRLGAGAGETAIIGDQLFTDILGGSRIGIRTILTAPVGEVELIHTRLLRVFERILLARLSGRFLSDGRWKEIKVKSSGKPEL